MVLSTKKHLACAPRLPKSIIFKGSGRNLLPMPASARHIIMLATAVLACSGLAGCGTINEKIAGGVSDAIPAAIGGLPADAPPRPGTAKYDEFMKERERKRLQPAAEREQEAKPSPAAQDTSR
jgi:hypothetical protein